MKRLIKKVLRYLVGSKPVQQQEEVLPKVNIKKGSNVQYWPSTIFQTSGNGLIELGNGVYIGRDVELSADTRHLLIHEESSIQDRCILIGEVEIGRYCTFAPNVYISSGRHYYDFKPEYYIRDQDALVQKTPELAKHLSKKVIIEDDCWLGINVVVMSGITIGKGSVIGANSVVTKNVEPYSVMTGAPAKLIKKRLDFVLKDEIQYSADTDLPNFYSGFLNELKTLKESRE